MTGHFGHLATRAPLAADDAFLARLYAATRADLMQLPLPAGVAGAIIRHQQQLQALGYATDFPKAEYLVLEHAGVPVGRAVVDASATEIRLVDLSIIPEARRCGHAAAVLRALQERSAQEGIPVALRVRKDNAGARELYASHGFVVISADELSEQMRWSAVPQGLPRRQKE